EHMIVEGKIAGRDMADPMRCLELPVPLAQGPGGICQALFVQLARPELFQREFEFAPSPDTGKAEVACDCHTSPRPMRLCEASCEGRGDAPRWRRMPPEMADITVSDLRCTPPGGMACATTEGLLAYDVQG